ncbi:hypothetical protein CEQ90_10485 [Lewinellaceae bacterium SD302]|nr:hypothetical protein CEQ90_10485 [Lewinellaceae bacterium SD302]
MVRTPLKTLLLASNIAWPIPSGRLVCRLIRFWIFHRVQEFMSWLQLDGSHQLYALFGAAFIMGLAKSGIKGLTMLAVPLLALNFGAKASTGLLVPILLAGDILAVIYYRRSANWKYVFRLIPAAVIGVVVAVVVGDWVNERTFQLIVSIVVLLSLGLIIYLERYPLDPKITQNRLPAFIAGLAGGFTTMIGNVGGPVMNVFLLSMRLPKLEFLGTAAYFFLLINIVKFPFHYFIWNTVSARTLLQDLITFPVIAIGFFIGIQIVKRIPEREFRYLVIVVTAVVAVRLLLS